MANLLNLERVFKSYGVRPLITDVSLGIGAGERIGIVGRNGDGKTTLLRIMTGEESPDEGRVSQQRGLLIGYLRQSDDFDDTHTVRDVVLGGMSDHEWAADSRLREVVEVLLAGVTLDRAVVGLSGGERRRCALAALLLGEHDLIVLDEPTNHLDVEAVAWLAGHLAARSSALVVVTHDRWFLDAVCQQTWEVHDGGVDTYEGGYAAFVLAKAERQRQASASEVRRQNLVRKELAWLRRGAPARTSKPKFRIDAANALIEDVPPPRDRLELQRFATQRLGKDVLDIEDVDLQRGDRMLLAHATWRLGPGDRVGIVGVNGAGKSSVLGLLAGEIAPDVGRVRQGRTVALEHLTQQVEFDDPESRVLATIEGIRRVTKTLDGEVSASALLERFGFTGDRLTARVGDLSGGERRRFQMLRLLLTEPNVLLLDEPTNDLDIETLNVLEDFLDGWPGTLVVVSHDRYFLERVTDSVWALLGDGLISMLPRGVDEYLERRARAVESSLVAPRIDPGGPANREFGPPPTGPKRSTRRAMALDSRGHQGGFDRCGARRGRGRPRSGRPGRRSRGWTSSWRGCRPGRPSSPPSWPTTPLTTAGSPRSPRSSTYSMRRRRPPRPSGSRLRSCWSRPPFVHRRRVAGASSTARHYVAARRSCSPSAMSAYPGWEPLDDCRRRVAELTGAEPDLERWRSLAMPHLWVIEVPMTATQVHPRLRRTRPQPANGTSNRRSRSASAFWSPGDRSASRSRSASSSAAKAPSTASLPSGVSRTRTPRRSDGSGWRSTRPRVVRRSTRLVIVPLVTRVSRSSRPGESW